MIINPELRRNLWLEFSLQRLIVTPLVIFAVLYLAYLTPNNTLNNVKDLAYFIFLFYVFLWGTKSASESIPDEINGHTWDFQRLSVLKPWTLSWGKLIGSTMYSWYGALLALIPYAILSLQNSSATTTTLFLKILVLVLGGLFAHSLALLSSMNALQETNNNSSANTKIKTYRYFIFGLFFSYLFISPTLSVLSISDPSRTITWHHFVIPSFTFCLTSLSLFLFWSILGIYRNMRQALQYQNLPWAWLAFTIFCMIYFSGFVSFTMSPSKPHVQNVLQHLPLYLGFFVASTLTYVALFSEKINIVTYKKRFPLPRWGVSLLLAILMGIWISFTPGFSTNDLNGSGLSSISTNIQFQFVPIIFVVSSILLLVRDILIVHYFQFAQNPKRALLTAAFYIILLYSLIPGLLQVLNLSPLPALFLPGTGIHYWALSLIGPAIQIALLGWMVKRRIG